MLLEAEGTRIGYDVLGDGDAMLLLLHAYPLSRSQWRQQAEALSHALALRVVTVDLRGCGQSSVDPQPITMERMAEDVLTLINALDPQGAHTVVLGGLSMGGYVALAAMRLFPDRIHGLILADTRATADTPEGALGREATAVFVSQRSPEELFDRDMPKLLSNRVITRHPNVVDLARRLAAVNTSTGLASVARGMALRQDSTALLPHIACPTLVLVGDQDMITPVSDARLLFERIPRAELTIIEDAGHLSNMERPELFTDHVASFLRDSLRVAPHA